MVCCGPLKIQSRDRHVPTVFFDPLAAAPLRVTNGTGTRW
jgi:hypothetical protein